MGQKQKTGEKEREKKKEEEEERTMVITMAKLRMAHAWRMHGARMAHASCPGQFSFMVADFQVLFL